MSHCPHQPAVPDVHDKKNADGSKRKSDEGRDGAADDVPHRDVPSHVTEHVLSGMLLMLLLLMLLLVMLVTSPTTHLWHLISYTYAFACIPDAHKQTLLKLMFCS